MGNSRKTLRNWFRPVRQISIHYAIVSFCVFFPMKCQYLIHVPCLVESVITPPPSQIMNRKGREKREKQPCIVRQCQRHFCFIFGIFDCFILDFYFCTEFDYHYLTIHVYISLEYTCNYTNAFIKGIYRNGHGYYYVQCFL